MPIEEGKTKDELNQERQERINTASHYLGLGEVFGYFFRKKDPNRPTNFNIKMMHGINKISIIVFLLGILFIVLKRIF